MSLNRVWGVICWLGLLGCTPLGAWLYEDPDLQVSRVRLTKGAADRSPVTVSLAVRNPNDYDLSTEHMQFVLRLDSIAVGRFARDSILALPRSGTAEIAFPLALEPGATREQVLALGAGSRHYLVEGEASVRTPFGKRVVRFASAGEMVFGGP